jgi:hypothetical protein
MAELQTAVKIQSQAAKGHGVAGQYHEWSLPIVDNSRPVLVNIVV